MARNRSAVIITCLRGKRSDHTPAKGEKTTADKTRAPRIKPRDVAVPPASRTVTASAIGNADAPKTNIVVLNQKRRYPLYDHREPASNSFMNRYYLTGLAFREAKT